MPPQAHDEAACPAAPCGYPHPYAALASLYTAPYSAQLRSPPPAPPVMPAARSRRHCPHVLPPSPTPPAPQGDNGGACQLFIGQVPAVCNDDQLKEVFLPFGTVVEARVMRDGKGRSKGSALVRYEAADAAARAIAAMHLQLILPPHSNPLTVRYAAAQKQRGGKASPPEGSVCGSDDGTTPPPSTPLSAASWSSPAAGGGTPATGTPAPSRAASPLSSVVSGARSPPPAPPRPVPVPAAAAPPPAEPAPSRSRPARPGGIAGAKLFVGQLPKTHDVAAVAELLAPYGELLDLRLLCDTAGTPSGAAFCVYRDEAAAGAAIAALNGRVTIPPLRTPLQVRYPDTPTDGTKLFVGQVPPSAQEADLRRVFGQFGDVVEAAVVLDRDGRSRRCAFVRFAAQESASAAIRALHRRTKMPGSSAALIVKPAQQRSAPPPAVTPQPAPPSAAPLAALPNGMATWAPPVVLATGAGFMPPQPGCWSAPPYACALPLCP